jgi:uncharacterized protein (UPF0332 family)
MSEPVIEIYLRKAEDSLTGAESEFANGRYDNCANRAYYACFQAAIAALLREGIRPPGQATRWGHDFVQARFVGDLINRRRMYLAPMREALFRGMELRQTADYKTERSRLSRHLARWLGHGRLWMPSSRKERQINERRTSNAPRCRDR